MRATGRIYAPLARWLWRQRHQTERTPSLHNLVFGTDLLRYLTHRTRYVLAVALLRTGLHIVEFGLLVYVMPTVIYHAMLFRLASLALESGWWGMTDAMRHHIRLLRRQNDLNGIQREMLGWLTLAGIVAAVVIALFAFAAYGRIDQSLPFAALILAMGFQTAVRIISRTFYSGAYAIRRVFLPVELILGPEILVFLMGVALYSVLDEWSVAICIAASSLLVACISYRYVRHVTDFLRITPVRMFSPRMLGHVFRHYRIGLLALSAVAALGMRLHDVVLIAALQAVAPKYVILRTVFPQELLFSLYLVMPLMRSCMHWAQVMYFDLSKYSLDRFAGFRTTLERVGLGYALLLSLVFCLLTAMVIALFAASVFPLTIRVIVPYMIVSSALGFVLISLFSRRCYGTVILLTSIQYAILWPLINMKAGWLPIADAMLLSLAVPLLLGWWRLTRAWLPPQERLESYLPWMSAVCRRRKPTLIVRMAFHPSVARRLPQDVARDIAYEWDDDAILCLHERSLLIALDADADPALEQQLIRFGRGFVARIDAVQADTGREAYEHGLASGMLLTLTGAGEISSGKIADEFRARFPTGLVHTPMRRNTKLVWATSSVERRNILYAARRGADMEKKGQADRWYVTSLYADPYLAAVFLVPKGDTNDAAHQAWQQLLDRWNLAALEAKYLKSAAAG